jgi:hypothetical protein
MHDEQIDRATGVGPSDTLRGYGASILVSFREHTWFAALLLAYAVVAIGISLKWGNPDFKWLRLYVVDFLPKLSFFVVGCLILRVLHALVIVRPRGLTRYIWADLTANPRVHQRFATGLPIVLLLPLFFSIFTSVKILIPAMNPFGWDRAFAELDMALHGGTPPWQLLQPLIGYPIITDLIDSLYFQWFFVFQIVCFWQAFSLRDALLRKQFLLTFLLLWVVVGNGLAILLSSAGPCFFEAAAGSPDPYAPLMQYLRSVDETRSIAAVSLQDWLWQSYQHAGVGIGKGISAMPSIHVGVAFVLALLGWRTHRVLGVLFSLYCGLILIGSVHLGWHYAVDGYVAIIASYVLWRCVGWWLTRPAPSPVPVIG